jgi:hypothetical protein
MQFLFERQEIKPVSYVEFIEILDKINDNIVFYMADIHDGNFVITMDDKKIIVKIDRYDSMNNAMNGCDHILTTEHIKMYYYINCNQIYTFQLPRCDIHKLFEPEFSKSENEYLDYAEIKSRNIVNTKIINRDTEKLGDKIRAIVDIKKNIRDEKQNFMKKGFDDFDKIMLYYQVIDHENMKHNSTCKLIVDAESCRKIAEIKKLENDLNESKKNLIELINNPFLDTFEKICTFHSMNKKTKKKTIITKENRNTIQAIEIIYYDQEYEKKKIIDSFNDSRENELRKQIQDLQNKNNILIERLKNNTKHINKNDKCCSAPALLTSEKRILTRNKEKIIRKKDNDDKKNNIERIHDLNNFISTFN